ncbi:Uncharacterized protein DBV15_03142 [Temnothorax longispinosus]|uniref:Uncharacterized protein n=1 Tax=Temnothorax longispinosus TaxID=300112 RepID=A0A4S2KNF0_9HYME|nr:Uncharacterized protein DBV15_03142 [Temnothorax longispinosus]
METGESKGKKRQSAVEGTRGPPAEINTSKTTRPLCLSSCLAGLVERVNCNSHRKALRLSRLQHAVTEFRSQHWRNGGWIMANSLQQAQQNS